MPTRPLARPSPADVAPTDTAPPWHALPVAEAARRLRGSADGLSAAEVRARLASVGPNAIDELPPPGLLVVAAQQFRSPLIYILLVATGVTLALGEHVDAVIIGAVLVLNAAIGTVQQRKAERSVHALQQLVSPKAHVVREGREAVVEARDLVPGDLVLLESGARVPADIRLAEAAHLTVDESMLTGESLPVAKQVHPLPEGTHLAERTSLVFAGSVIARGRGRGYAVATGMRTELGRIAEHVHGGQAPRTPLQDQMDRFAQRIGLIVLAAAGLAFAIGVVLGQPAAAMFSFAVALAVSAIPEGLPVVFTIALAVGVTRMARRQAIVRHLPAVETLGCTTVICSDKTGTLTRNAMAVREVRTTAGRFVTRHVAEGEVELTGEQVASADELHLALLTGVLASEAEAANSPDPGEVGEGQAPADVGDPTELALLHVAADLGMQPRRLRLAHPLVQHLAFEPERRFAAVVTDLVDGRALLVQGAPERVLAMCDTAMVHGRVVPVDRAAVAEDVRQMGAAGLRVLAFAWRAVEGEVPRGELEDPAGMTLLGLQGMADPPRDGVPEAIAACRDAGVRVIMITGDHVVTAKAIGDAIGLDDGVPLDGVDLDALDGDGLRAALRCTSVFARVSPEQKLRIVTALREVDEVVAVTGDGVNDAPALQAADIGIAMGRSGTDVAREAADVVLADDDFVTIRAAVEEGRITFDNLRKATFFLLSTGAAEILMLLTGLVLGWPLILLPAQLLWLNLVTNGVQDVALAFEPGEDDVLRRRPRARREGLLQPLLWERTALVAVVMGTGTLLTFDWALASTGSLEVARAMAMTTMVCFQAVHVGNARQERRSAFASPPWRNPFLLAAVVIALGVHAAALQLPATRWVLRVVPLTAAQWGVALATSLSVLVAVELHKRLRRPR